MLLNGYRTTQHHFEARLSLLRWPGNLQCIYALNRRRRDGAYLCGSHVYGGASLTSPFMVAVSRSLGCKGGCDEVRYREGEAGIALGTVGEEGEQKQGTKQTVKGLAWWLRF